MIIRAPNRAERQRMDDEGRRLVEEVILPFSNIAIPELNGEIVVNNVIINAPNAFYVKKTRNVIFSNIAVPLQPIAEELGLEFYQSDVLPSIELGLQFYQSDALLSMISIGNVSFIIGSTAVRRTDNNSLNQFSFAPYIDDDGVIFVPLTVFSRLGKRIQISDEGQVVIENRSDMR